MGETIMCVAITLIVTMWIIMLTMSVVSMPKRDPSLKMMVYGYITVMWVAEFLLLALAVKNIFNL